MFNDFWQNVLRYPKYFITIGVGIFLSIFGWLVPLLKRPITAIAVIGFLLGTVFFVSLTLRAMLGFT
jgi:hypothetical protein